MQQDDNNPYAPPVDVEDKSEPVYDLHSLARYYNKTTMWGRWFVRILLIEIVLVLAAFFVTDVITEHHFVTITLTILFPVHLCMTMLFLCLTYFAFKMSLQMKLKHKVLNSIVIDALASGFSLPWLRSQARKILDRHGAAEPKNGLYDLASIKQIVEF